MGGVGEGVGVTRDTQRLELVVGEDEMGAIHTFSVEMTGCAVSRVTSYTEVVQVDENVLDTSLFHAKRRQQHGSVELCRSSMSIGDLATTENKLPNSRQPRIRQILESQMGDEVVLISMELLQRALRHLR